MPSPLVVIALLAGGAYLMFTKDDTKKASGSIALPTGPNGQQATATIQVPVVDSEVAPEHTPSVTLTVPQSVAQQVTSNDIAGRDPISYGPSAQTTAVTPGIAQASKVTTNPQTTVSPVQVPIGTTSFPIPATATAQQVAETVMPAVIQQAANAIQNAVATNPNVTPLHTEEIKVDQDPHGTVALARAMLNAELNNGWKTALKPEITMWQSKVGLKADGKFGEGSAYKMAEEVGVLPLIRYWSLGGSGNKASSLKAYRDRLYTMAANADSHNPPLAAALRSSAQYEQAQAWGTNPGAISSQSRTAQASALTSAIKQAVS